MYDCLNGVPFVAPTLYSFALAVNIFTCTAVQPTMLVAIFAIFSRAHDTTAAAAAAAAAASWPLISSLCAKLPHMVRIRHDLGQIYKKSDQIP